MASRCAATALFAFLLGGAHALRGFGAMRLLLFRGIPVPQVDKLVELYVAAFPLACVLTC